MYETAETSDETGQINLNGLTLQCFLHFLHIHSYKHAKIPSKKLHSSESKPLSIFMTSVLTAGLNSHKKLRLSLH